MRLPKINFEQQGWPQFLLGMLIMSPIFGAIIAGRWVATTLPYSVALPLGIAAAILSWVFTANMIILSDRRLSAFMALLILVSVFTTMSFGIIVSAFAKDSISRPS